MRRSVGRTGAPASIPMQPGQATRFTSMSATGQIGSRTDLPHCTPRHHFGVDGTRDWLHRSEPESSSRIVGRLSPCLRRRPPRNFRSDSPLRRGLDARSETLPSFGAWGTIYGRGESPQVPMFLRVSSFHVHRLWTLTCGSASRCVAVHRNVELCIHSVHVSTSPT